MHPRQSAERKHGRILGPVYMKMVVRTSLWEVEDSH